MYLSSIIEYLSYIVFFQQPPFFSDIEKRFILLF